MDSSGIVAGVILAATPSLLPKPLLWTRSGALLVRAVRVRRRDRLVLLSGIGFPRADRTVVVLGAGASRGASFYGGQLEDRVEALED